MSKSSFRSSSHVLSVSNFFTINSENISLWHQILGHLPISNMKNLSSFHMSSSLSDLHYPCDVCAKAIRTKLPFTSSTASTNDASYSCRYIGSLTKLLYIMVLDISVHDYSRGICTYSLKTKSNAFYVLKQFLVLVERQFQNKVKIIRSDNVKALGSSLTNSDFLSFQGIIHQITCVSTPQQNGIVERKHTHLLKNCRALLFQSHFPLSYWGNVF